jgi:hypothetical protein
MSVLNSCKICSQVELNLIEKMERKVYKELSKLVFELGKKNEDHIKITDNGIVRHKMFPFNFNKNFQEDNK